MSKIYGLDRSEARKFYGPDCSFLQFSNKTDLAPLVIYTVKEYCLQQEESVCTRPLQLSLFYPFKYARVTADILSTIGAVLV